MLSILQIKIFTFTFTSNILANSSGLTSLTLDSSSSLRIKQVSITQVFFSIFDHNSNRFVPLTKKKQFQAEFQPKMAPNFPFWKIQGDFSTNSALFSQILVELCQIVIFKNFSLARSFRNSLDGIA